MILRYIPWPLVVSVCKWYIHHPHECLFDKGTITLAIILLQNLAPTLWTYRQHQSSTWFQLI